MCRTTNDEGDGCRLRPWFFIVRLDGAAFQTEWGTTMTAFDSMTGVEQLMSTLYLTEQYSVVKREGEALRVQIPARDSVAARVVRVPLIKVDQVVVFGDITLTA